MSKELIKQQLAEEHEVTVAADRTYKSVSVSFNGAVGSKSSRIDIINGMAKVTAKNTGSRHPMYIKLKNGTYSQLKSWEIDGGETLNTGEFSVPSNTYWLEIGSVSAYIPTSGTATLTGILPL